MFTGCTHDQTLEEVPWVLRKRTHVTFKGVTHWAWCWLASLGPTPEKDMWTDDLWKALHFRTANEADNVAVSVCSRATVQVARCTRCDDIIAGRY